MLLVSVEKNGGFNEVGECLTLSVRDIADPIL